MSDLLRRTAVRVSFFVLFILGQTGCHDLLNAPVPGGVVAQTGLTGARGAEALRIGAMAAFTNAFDGGLIQYSGTLVDEFTDLTGVPTAEAIDARTLNANQSSPFDLTYSAVQGARVQGLQAVTALESHAAVVPASDIAQTFALIGYTEVFLAETVCSGVPLTQVALDGTVSYAAPISRDSLLSQAVAHFDSALAHFPMSDTIRSWALVGRGRALLDKGQFRPAATAVAGVPPSFVFVVQADPTTTGFYQSIAQNALVSVSDGEGRNGEPFVSAHDPRLPIDSLGVSPNDGKVWYYPARFPIGGNPPISLADGIEATLIRAEALLPQNGGAGSSWLDSLNALRASSGDTALSNHPLVDPGVSTQQVNLLFRERAFWLFGTAHRLGDLRRLVRQYGRSADSVFPTGPYAGGTGSPFAAYGSTTVFSINAIEHANPRFHGCIDQNP